MPVELGSAYGKVIIDSSGVKSGVENAKKGTDSLQSSFKSMAKGIGTAAALVTGVVATMKKIFEFGEEGAKITQMGDSFNTLMNEVGAAPGILDKLRKASRGTIDDYTLMSSTATLLAGAQGDLATQLVNATPALLEMAKAAQKLNPELGDVTFLYDSLAKGIKRGSPMILDNLGIIVKLEEANQKYAESIGKTADELTSEQQKIALLNEVLRNGNVLLKQAGGTVDSATDSYAKLNTAVKNSTNEFKAWIGKALEPAAEGLAILINWKKEIKKAFDDAAKSAIYSTKTYDDYKLEIIRLGVATGNLSKDVYEFAKAGKYSGEITYDMAAQLGGLTKAEWDALRAGAALGDYMDGPLRSAMANVGRSTKEDIVAAMEEATEVAADFSSELDYLQSLVGGEVTEAYDDFKEKQGELNAKVDELKGKIAELEGKKYLTPAQKEELADLKIQLGGAQKAVEEHAGAWDEATKKIIWDMAVMRANADGMVTDMEWALLSKMGETWGLFDENTKTALDGVNEAFNVLATGQGMTAALAKIYEVRGAIADIDGNHNIHFNITSSGSLPSLPSRNKDTGVAIQAYATGVKDYIIPPGYPRDTYLVGLTSGEKLNVEPVGGWTENKMASQAQPAKIVQIEKLIGEVYVQNDMDVRMLARRVADEIQRINN